MHRMWAWGRSAGVLRRGTAARGGLGLALCRLAGGKMRYLTTMCSSHGECFDNFQCAHSICVQFQLLCL
jgi:hypothetical protein